MTQSKTTTAKLKLMLEEKKINDKKKLSRQQAYYHRLKSKGIAQAENYNLRPIAAIGNQ